MPLPTFSFFLFLFFFFFFFTAKLIYFNHFRKCRCPQLHCHQVVKSSNLVLRMINTRLILPVEADRIISGLSLEPGCFSERVFLNFFWRDNSWRHRDQLEHTRGGFEVNSRRNGKPRWVGPLVGCDTWYEKTLTLAVSRFFKNVVEIECKGLKTTESLPSHTPTQGESEEGGEEGCVAETELCFHLLAPRSHYIIHQPHLIQFTWLWKINCSLLTSKKRHIQMLHYIKKVYISPRSCSSPMLKWL